MINKNKMIHNLFSHVFRKLVPTFCILSLLITVPLQADTGKNAKKNIAPHLEKYKTANPFYQKGLQLLQQGHRDAAHKELRKAIEIMPKHVFAHYHLASSLFQQGDYTKAEIHISQTQRHFQFMMDLKAYARSVNFRALSRDETKLGNLLDRDKHQFDCSTTNVLKYKKYQVVNQIKTLTEKEKLQKKQDDALHAGICFLQGNILLQLKKFPEAFRAFEKTTQLSPTLWEAHNNMAALLHLGKAHDKAFTCLQNAENNGAGFNINLKLKEDIYKALGKDTDGITQQEYPGGVKRFTVDVNKTKNPTRRFYENTYIIYDPKTKDAAIIDPGYLDPRIDAFIVSQNLNPKLILNTHGHSDHTAANHQYARKYNITIAAPKQDAHLYPKTKAPGTIRYFKKGDTLSAGSLKIKTNHLPGHTPGSTCFLINNSLFTGDTIFQNTIGKITGKDKQTRQTNYQHFITQLHQTLSHLPETTPIYPGHGNATNIKTEKNNNPYLKKQ